MAVGGLVAVVAVVGGIWVIRGGGDAEPLPGTPLKELGKARGVELGTAVRGDVLKRVRAYRQLVAAQFSTVTPENEMKWEVVAPERGKFEFGAADDIVRRADEAGQKIRGHTLVWHAQTPRWVRELGPADLLEALREHIRAVVGRWEREVGVWDVVNEPIADSGRLRRSVFMRRLGPGYIEDAFRTARAADADAKLYLNEIGADGINPKSDRLYAIVRDLKARGVPIDGVGLQSHVNLDGVAPGFVENMRRFRALGLDVAITEADVGVRLPPDAQALDRQADIYAQIVRACLAVKCASLTLWGFTDRYSWISETQPGMGAATLLDDKFAPKPAFAAVQRALRG